MYGSSCLRSSWQLGSRWITTTSGRGNCGVKVHFPLNPKKTLEYFVHSDLDGDDLDIADVASGLNHALHESHGSLHHFINQVGPEKKMFFFAKQFKKSENGT